MHRTLVTVLCLVQFVDVLGVTSAVTAIPAILAGVGAPPGAAGPLATVYAMFFGGLLILGARLGERYGHRRVLLTGVVAFVLVSAVAAAVTAIGPLLVARGLQGGAAAVSVPSALTLLLAASSPTSTDRGVPRRDALAAWSVSGATAGAAGFVVGGLLAELLGWRSVFWVNVPVGIALVAGVLAVVPADPPRPARSGRTALDLPGALVLLAAVAGLVAGGALLESPATRAAGAAVVALGLLLGAWFVVRERRAAQPLVPGAAVRSPTLRAGTLVSFVNTATTTSAAVLASLVLQDELGASALEAGVTLMTLSLAVVAGSTASRPLGARLPPTRVAALGLGVIAVGDVVLALTLGTRWGVVAGAVALGLGLGLASVAGNTLGTSVPESLAPGATGILNTGAQLGAAIGTAALVLVASVAGVVAGWLVAAVAAAATALAVLRGPRVAAGG